MIALIFSALLAQAAPTPAASDTAPAASAAPLQPLQPLTGNDNGITRRMPVRLPAFASTDAVIHNSGSTNTTGYTVVVHPDFSADVYQGGSSRHAAVAGAQAKWLFAKLKADEPFTSMGAVHCMKSSSFGTTTTIAYDGTTTPDLSCGSGDEGRELSRTIGIIVNQLGVQSRVGTVRRLML